MSPQERRRRLLWSYYDFWSFQGLLGPGYSGNKKEKSGGDIASDILMTGIGGVASFGTGRSLIIIGGLKRRREGLKK